MAVTPFGIVMLRRLLQAINAPDPIFVAFARVDGRTCQPEAVAERIAPDSCERRGQAHAGQIRAKIKNIAPDIRDALAEMTTLVTKLLY